jgi:hypothetical protein
MCGAADAPIVSRYGRGDLALTLRGFHQRSRVNGQTHRAIRPTLDRHKIAMLRLRQDI